MNLKEFTWFFAEGMALHDAKRPKHPIYGEWGLGIGPFEEKYVVKMVMQELEAIHPGTFQYALEQQYPLDQKRNPCDLVLFEEDVASWAIETKMLRYYMAKGGKDDTSLKEMLSPFKSDRGAIADCIDLQQSNFQCNKAILIFGYDKGPDDERQIQTIIKWFEKMVADHVELGDRYESPFVSLVHPIHKRAKVMSWEIK